MSAVPVDVAPKSRTILNEILAWRSLLEPRFRYLSPGRKGEKCQSLDHLWQIPFTHSVRFVITCNSCIYINESLPAISSIWYVKVCLRTVGIFWLRMCSLTNCQLKVENGIFKILQLSCKCWCILPKTTQKFYTRICWTKEIISSIPIKISSIPIKICRLVLYRKQRF